MRRKEIVGREGKTKLLRFGRVKRENQDILRSGTLEGERGEAGGSGGARSTLRRSAVEVKAQGKGSSEGGVNECKLEERGHRGWLGWRHVGQEGSTDCRVMARVPSCNKV